MPKSRFGSVHFYGGLQKDSTIPRVAVFFFVFNLGHPVPPKQPPGAVGRLGPMRTLSLKRWEQLRDAVPQASRRGKWGASAGGDGGDGSNSGGGGGWGFLGGALCWLRCFKREPPLCWLV